jgi:hypothetical protein
MKTKTLTVTLSIFIVLSSFSQDIVPKTYVINFDRKDSCIKAEVYYENPKVKTKKGRFYHWYTKDAFNSTEGDFSGKLLHGQYSCFYGNKNLKEKGIYQNGLRKGTWTRWHPNGVIAEVSNWSNGLKDGIFQLFSTTGVKLLEASYRNGKLHGKVTAWNEGKVITEKKYRNGKEKSEISPESFRDQKTENKKPKIKESPKIKPKTENGKRKTKERKPLFSIKTKTP